MNNNTLSKRSQPDVLRKLISIHRQFQEELDIITSSNIDPVFVDGLIELRKFNIRCINRYSAMITKSSIDLIMPQSDMMFKLNSSEDELMWKIHHELATMVQIYTKEIVSGDLSEFNRMIIARNLDIIINQKDEILHPVPTSELS